MILAITHAGDAHAPLVLGALRELGAELEVLDLSELPRNGRVTVAFGSAGRAAEICLDGRAPISLDALRLAPVILQAYVPGVDVRA